ncbi:MAG TPA: Mur ligase, partial [Opitutaceae bacterium]|nr:Mur ligase [Opitutaceae bacterium]
DFGHHPTALAETLISFRNRYPGAHLTAVFEPRSNTARTNVLQTAFMEALARADAVFLGAVNRADKLKPEERFDTAAVLAHLTGKGVEGCATPTNLELLDALLHAQKTAPTDRPRVVVFFSNGSFDGIIPRFVEAAR